MSLPVHRVIVCVQQVSIPAFCCFACAHLPLAVAAAHGPEAEFGGEHVLGILLVPAQHCKAGAVPVVEVDLQVHVSVVVNSVYGSSAGAAMPPSLHASQPQAGPGPPAGPHNTRWFALCTIVHIPAGPHPALCSPPAASWRSTPWPWGSWATRRCGVARSPGTHACGHMAKGKGKDISHQEARIAEP